MNTCVCAVSSYQAETPRVQSSNRELALPIIPIDIVALTLTLC